MSLALTPASDVLQRTYFVLCFAVNMLCFAWLNESDKRIFKFFDANRCCDSNVYAFYKNEMTFKLNRM